MRRGGLGRRAHEPLAKRAACGRTRAGAALRGNHVAEGGFKTHLKAPLGALPVLLLLLLSRPVTLATLP